ncbi:MAG: iron-containing alcohol dehydrogenase [Spirochaetia bacterium]|nr:iron-containing alcohol dehydrogenase [Spirochaetia bacterium]
MFTFNLPTTWIHGIGAIQKIPGLLQELHCTSPLIVTDRRLIDLEGFSRITRDLADSHMGYEIFGGATKEPTVTGFTEAAAKLDLKKYDAIIAVGGGSVIDTAKGLRVIARFGGVITDYAGFGKIPRPTGIPLIAVPTTSGTGSEVSDGAVFTDEAKKTKFAVGGLYNFPTIAVTDPAMTVSMPPFVTAVSGIDALVHAVESYISKHASTVTELFALEAIRRIGSTIETAFRNGSDIEAREQMQLGATLAMVSTVNAKLGFCHAIAMPLCALYGLPHGQVCGVVLPGVLEYNADVVPKKVEKIARILGMVSQDETYTASLFRQRLQELIDEKLGLKVRLMEHGYTEADNEAIVKGTLGSFQSQNNPRTISPEGIINITESIV